MNSFKFYKIFFTLLFVLSSIVGWGQATHQVEITGAEGANGIYLLADASFGPSFCDYETTGPASLQLITDTDTLTTACVGITNDLTGQIAIIDRGGCGFTAKVTFAEAQGAIAVIVCDNVNGTLSGLGGTDATITIPSWKVTKEDCDVFRVFLDQGLMGTVTRAASEFPVPDGIFFTEDFAEGSNGWESESLNAIDSSWFWVSDGAIPRFSGAAHVFTNVESACGGVMIFPGGWYGTNSTGDSDIDNGNEYEVALISPTIDASSACQVLFVEFDMLYRGGNVTNRMVPDLLDPTAIIIDNGYIQYSIDDGATWSGGLSFTSAFPAVTTINQRITSALPGAGGSSQLRIRFVHNQDFAYIGLDNISLYSAPENQLEIQNNFFATAPNLFTPASQVQEMAFLTDIRNIGCEEQVNTRVVITITDPDGVVIYTDENDSYGTTAGGGPLLENSPFLNLYTPPAIPGVYTGTYSLSSDSDTLLSNEISFPFVITEENTFAKENGPVSVINASDTNWPAGAKHSWGYGNAFYLPNGNDYYVDSIGFSISTVASDAGKILQINLYDWVDDDGDGDMQFTERILLGFFDYEIVGTEAFEIINVALEADSGDDRIILSDAMTVVAVVERADDDEVTENIMGYSAFISEFANYNAMQLAFDSLATLTNDPSIRRYSAFGYLEDSDETTITDGAFNELVPVVRLSIATTISDVDDPLADENVMEVYPNPTQDQLTLNIQLIENEQFARVNIIDIMGKVIRSFEHENVRNNQFAYNVNDLTAGAYFLQYVSETGSRTLKFTKQ